MGGSGRPELRPGRARVVAGSAGSDRHRTYGIGHATSSAPGVVVRPGGAAQALDLTPRADQRPTGRRRYLRVPLAGDCAQAVSGVRAIPPMPAWPISGAPAWPHVSTGAHQWRCSWSVASLRRGLYSGRVRCPRDPLRCSPARSVALPLGLACRWVFIGGAVPGPLRLSGGGCPQVVSGVRAIPRCPPGQSVALPPGLTCRRVLIGGAVPGSLRLSGGGCPQVVSGVRAIRSDALRLDQWRSRLASRVDGCSSVALFLVRCVSPAGGVLRSCPVSARSAPMLSGPISGAPASPACRWVLLPAPLLVPPRAPAGTAPSVRAHPLRPSGSISRAPRRSAPHRTAPRYLRIPPAGDCAQAAPSVRAISPMLSGPTRQHPPISRAPASRHAASWVVPNVVPPRQARAPASQPSPLLG
ncbi:hypothetical protein SUDANB178_01680 [Streptomyces sp. enrichment culture]